MSIWAWVAIAVFVGFLLLSVWGTVALSLSVQ